MCYYAPFGSKEMWDWHTTVTIKKQNSEIYANKEDAKLTGVLGAFPPLYAGVAQMVEQLHDQRARVRVRPPAPKISKLP